LRRSLAAALGSALALLVPAAAIANSLAEPVSIAASAPATATVGTPFEVAVAVEADPAALDIAIAPLRVRVKLAPECGGSFVGTPGPTAFEATLPNPIPPGSFAGTFSGRVTESAAGTEIVCAFLEDAQERQFATDTGVEVGVSAPTSGGGGIGTKGGAGPSCPAATQALSTAKLDLRRIEKRIRKVQRAERHAHGKHRRVLAKRLRKLRRKERVLARRRRVEAHTVAGSCA
jgi:hypothetical protein